MLNKTTIPNTSITLKEFKELLKEKFNAYPIMHTDYKNKRFIVTNSFYDNIDITQIKLINFCKKLGISYKKGFYNWGKCVFIDLAS